MPVSRNNFGAATEAAEVAATYQAAIKGKTILITGVNKAGIGYGEAAALASQLPKALVFAGRTPAKLEESIELLHSQYPDVTYRAVNIDISLQASVHVPKIDIVINNAGTLMGDPEPVLTPDKHIEIHFATNHLGHFLLTNLLMPKILAAAKDNPHGATRIVNVSSNGMRDGGIRFSDINFTKPQNQLPEDERHLVENIRKANGGSFDPDKDTYIIMSAYAQSKAANVLFSVELTRRLLLKHGILSVAVYPGIILTEMSRFFPQETVSMWLNLVDQGVIVPRSLGAGAATSLVAALDPALDEFAFLEDCQVAPEDTLPEFSSGLGPAGRLWRLTEELVGENFDLGDSDVG